jgi:hypothetical protein
LPFAICWGGSQQQGGKEGGLGGTPKIHVARQIKRTEFPFHDLTTINSSTSKMVPVYDEKNPSRPINTVGLMKLIMIALMFSLALFYILYLLERRHNTLHNIIASSPIQPSAFFMISFGLILVSYGFYRQRTHYGKGSQQQHASLKRKLIVGIVSLILICLFSSLRIATQVHNRYDLISFTPQIQTAILTSTPSIQLEWQNISLKHLDKYFNELEMKSLGVNMDAYRDIQNHLQNESFMMKEDKLRELILQPSLRECDTENMPRKCCIGSISNGGGILWNKDQCLPMQTNYFRRLVPRGTKDPYTVRYHTMADVMHILGNNRTLFFVGDSVMGQIAEDAALCSWARNTRKDYEYPSVSFFSDQNLNTTEQRWIYQAFLSEWDIETPTGNLAKIRYLKAYRPEDDFSNILHWANQFQPDVMVINFGLHYLIEGRHVYAGMVRNFLEKFRSYALSKPLIFRETSAQHLATDGGEWNTRPDPDWNITSEKQTCQPLRFVERSNTSSIYGLWDLNENDLYEEDSSLLVPTIKKWRENIIRKEALALGYRIESVDHYFPSTDSEKTTTSTAGAATCQYFNSNDNSEEKTPILFIIPFYDWTEDLWDGHDFSDNEKGCEPTHFCSSPLVWEHIYNCIYGILARSKPFCEI